MQAMPGHNSLTYSRHVASRILQRIEQIGVNSVEPDRLVTKKNPVLLKNSCINKIFFCQTNLQARLFRDQSVLTFRG